jgi:hypothetical protein
MADSFQDPPTHVCTLTHYDEFGFSGDRQLPSCAFFPTPIEGESMCWAVRCSTTGAWDRV